MAYPFYEDDCSQNLQVSTFERDQDECLNMMSLSHQNALVKLMQKTGYSMIQHNGQRHYGGPPPGWKGPTPGKGTVG